MKSAKAAIYLSFLAAAFLLLPTRAKPQSQIASTLAEKQAEASPRTTLAGAWTFDRYQSDNPLEKVREVELTGGGTASRGRGGTASGGQNIEDNPKMKPLLSPAASITLELKTPEIDVTQGPSPKLILYTDGRRIGKQTDNLRVEVAAYWVDNRLVTDEKSPLGGKMDRIFELSPDGRQLFETLDVDNGRSDTPIRIHYVYDLPGSGPQFTGDPDSTRIDPATGRPTLRKGPERGGSGSSQ